jgi:hypothetical protein
MMSRALILDLAFVDLLFTDRVMKSDIFNWFNTIVNNLTNVRIAKKMTS